MDTKKQCPRVILGNSNKEQLRKESKEWLKEARLDAKDFNDFYNDMRERKVK